MYTLGSEYARPLKWATSKYICILETLKKQTPSLTGVVILKHSSQLQSIVTFERRIGEIQYTRYHSVSKCNMWERLNGFNLPLLARLEVNI